MNKIIRISIYLLIAFMLMGTEKCDSPYLKKPYVPDPTCKRDLQESLTYSKDAISRLLSFGEADSDRLIARVLAQEGGHGQEFAGSRARVRTRLRDRYQDLELAIRSIGKSIQAATRPLQANKIKDGSKPILDTMITDLRSQNQNLENYEKIWTNMSKVNNIFHQGGRVIYMRNLSGILSGLKDTQKVIPVVREYLPPLADLIKDGCVARS
jgi:hypothetical protein